MEKLEKFPLPFALKFEGSKDSRKFERMNTLHVVLHDMTWKIFDGLLDLASIPSRKSGPNTKLKTMTLQHLIFHGLLLLIV